MSNVEHQVLLLSAAGARHIKNQNKFEASIWTSNMAGNLLETSPNLNQYFLFVFFFLVHFFATICSLMQLLFSTVSNSLVFGRWMFCIWLRSVTWHVNWIFSSQHWWNQKRERKNEASIVCRSNLASLWCQITAKISSYLCSFPSAILYPGNHRPPITFQANGINLFPTDDFVIDENNPNIN